MLTVAGNRGPMVVMAKGVQDVSSSSQRPHLVPDLSPCRPTQSRQMKRKNMSLEWFFSIISCLFSVT